ncbi:MAG: hypothetical protein ACOYCB_01955 [Fastidiosipilaceae bacterium]|jgi:hypothetical protein|nr:zinc ribbon domain-containing protein [Clostridiaceae bacterium]
MKQQYCPECGRKQMPDAVFCDGCGYDFKNTFLDVEQETPLISNNPQIDREKISGVDSSVSPVQTSKDADITSRAATNFPENEADLQTDILTDQDTTNSGNVKNEIPPMPYFRPDVAERPPLTNTNVQYPQPQFSGVGEMSNNVFNGPTTNPYLDQPQSHGSNYNFAPNQNMTQPPGSEMGMAQPLDNRIPPNPHNFGAIQAEPKSNINAQPGGVQYQPIAPPHKKKSKSFVKPLIIVLAVLIVLGAAFAVWKFILRKDGGDSTDLGDPRAYVIEHLSDQSSLKHKPLNVSSETESSKNTETYFSVLQLIQWSKPWEQTVNDLTKYFNKRPIIETDISTGYHLMTIKYNNVKLADKNLNFTLLTVDDVIVGYWFEFGDLDRQTAITDVEASFGAPQNSYAWAYGEEDAKIKTSVGEWSTIVIIVNQDNNTISFFVTDFFQKLDPETYNLLN